jgi:hypothetical protein
VTVSTQHSKLKEKENHFKYTSKVIQETAQTHRNHCLGNAKNPKRQKTKKLLKPHSSFYA